MFIVNAILLGVGLAMDAFSVSVVNGMNEPGMRFIRMSLIAGIFGLFQFAMPLIGYGAVHTFLEYFTVFTKFIPYIAFGLLLYIGGKMIIEARENCDEEGCHFNQVTFRELIIQGIATSIDALSVGFTIAEHTIPMALTETIIIGVTTYVICLAGLVLGKKFGTRFNKAANYVGGIILISIGLEILIKSFL